jgi:hypothetical protein
VRLIATGANGVLHAEVELTPPPNRKRVNPRSLSWPHTPGFSGYRRTRSEGYDGLAPCKSWRRRFWNSVPEVTYPLRRYHLAIQFFKHLDLPPVIGDFKTGQCGVEFYAWFRTAQPRPPRSVRVPQTRMVLDDLHPDHGDAEPPSRGRASLPGWGHFD